MVDIRTVRACWVCGILSLLCASLAWSQAPAKPAAKPADGKAAPTVKDAEDKLKTLTQGSKATEVNTKDGVRLSVRVWLPVSGGKEAPIVLLLPALGMTQLEWYPIAKSLQNKGMAVAAFDYRGHGDSQFVDPKIYVPPHGKLGDKTGAKKEKEKDIRKETRIDYAEILRTKQDYESLLIDVETVKEHLVRLNDQGAFNINRLGLAAAGELSCAVATHWTAMEYAKKNNGTRAGDVQTLVLITPGTNYKGFKSEHDFTAEGKDLPILLVSSTPNQADAKSLARLLRLPEPQNISVKAAKADDKDKKKTVGPSRANVRTKSFWLSVDHKSQGMTLVNPPIEQMDQRIVAYLEGRLLTDKSTKEWVDRKIDSLSGSFGSGKTGSAK